MPVRKIPMSYRSLTGRHALAPGGRSVGFESSLERDFVTLMSFDPTVTVIEEQPVRIDYRDGKRARHYTPDFLVSRDGDRSLLVEVKYAAELKEKAETLEPKFQAARRYAKKREWVFEVWTENEIRIPRLENARFLLPYRERNPDPGLCARILRCLEKKPSLTVEGVLESCWAGDRERARGLSALWHLLARGRIHADFDLVLGNDTPLQRVGDQSVV